MRFPARHVVVECNRVRDATLETVSEGSISDIEVFSVIMGR